jgi:polyhydroxyalkanoate synthesis regulator phasin
MIIKHYDPEKESRIIKGWKKFVNGLKRLTNEKWDVSIDSSENQSNLVDELNSNLSKEMNGLRNDYEERIRLMEKKIECLSEQLKLVDIESKIDHLENSIKKLSKNTV